VAALPSELNVLSMHLMFSKKCNKIFNISLNFSYRSILFFTLSYKQSEVCSRVQNVVYQFMNKFCLIQCDQLWACLFVYGNGVTHWYIQKVCLMSIVKCCGWSVNHVILWNSNWKIFVSKLEVSQQCFIFQWDKFNVMHTIKWLSWLASWSIWGKYV
jgi:hypothetical protein